MLELVINGQKYLGWESLRLRKSMEDFAHGFDLQLSDRWTAEQSAIAVEAGQPVEIRLGGQLVLTGYIDEDAIEYGPNHYRLRVSGRSKTGDLVDCSAQYEGGQWKEASLIKIVSDLCSPYDIKVIAPVSPKKFRRFAIDDGETVFDCISRAAFMSQLLPLTDVRGNVVLAKAASVVENATIERGVNALEGGRSNSWRDAFSDYTLKNQNAGNDDRNGKDASEPKAEVSDDRINRHRSLVMHPSGQLNGQDLKARASWEAAIRWGRSRRLRYKLIGWGHASGLWTPNRIVKVKDDYLRVDDDLLVVSVDYLQNLDEGTVSILELTRPEAFDTEPIPRKSNKRGALW